MALIEQAANYAKYKEALAVVRTYETERITTDQTTIVYNEAGGGNVTVPLTEGLTIKLDLGMTGVGQIQAKTVVTNQPSSPLGATLISADESAVYPAVGTLR